MANNFLGGNQKTSNSRFLRLLQANRNLNTGTTTGGLAHVLNMAAQGYASGVDQNQETASNEAMSKAVALMQGTNPRVLAAPSVASNLGDDEDETLGQGITIPGVAPNMQGAIGVLSNNSKYAPLAMQLRMGQNAKKEAAALLRENRTYAEGRSKVEFDRRIEQEKVKRKLRLMDVLDELTKKDELAREREKIKNSNANTRAANKPYLDLGLQPPNRGQGQPAAVPVPGSSPQAAQPPMTLSQARAAQAESTATAKATGKSLGEARADLPKVLAKGQRLLAILDQIAPVGKDGKYQIDPNREYDKEYPKYGQARTHPGFRSMVGGTINPSAIVSRLPFVDGPMGGTKEADFHVLMKQVKGNQFLEAFESIKGAGQITEVEGNKATDAIARMDTLQSEEAFLAALQEFRGVVTKALSQAIKYAAGPTPQQTSLKKKYNLE
tara:strand:- start:758 stop:2074 length:1317 start_codon:yes stop_codon:yes gene_type:complete